MIFHFLVNPLVRNDLLALPRVVLSFFSSLLGVDVVVVLGASVSDDFWPSLSCFLLSIAESDSDELSVLSMGLSSCLTVSLVGANFWPALGVLEIFKGAGAFFKPTETGG